MLPEDGPPDGIRLEGEHEPEAEPFWQPLQTAPVEIPEAVADVGPIPPSEAEATDDVAAKSESGALLSNDDVLKDDGGPLFDPPNPAFLLPFPEETHGLDAMSRLAEPIDASEWPSGSSFERDPGTTAHSEIFQALPEQYLDQVESSLTPTEEKAAASEGDYSGLGPKDSKPVDYAQAEAVRSADVDAPDTTSPDEVVIEDPKALETPTRPDESTEVQFASALSQPEDVGLGGGLSEQATQSLVDQPDLAVDASPTLDVENEPISSQGQEGPGLEANPADRDIAEEYPGAAEPTKVKGRRRLRIKPGLFKPRHTSRPGGENIPAEVPSSVQFEATSLETDSESNAGASAMSVLTAQRSPSNEPVVEDLSEASPLAAATDTGSLELTQHEGGEGASAGQEQALAAGDRPADPVRTRNKRRKRRNRRQRISHEAADILETRALEDQEANALIVSADDDQHANRVNADDALAGGETNDIREQVVADTAPEEAALVDERDRPADTAKTGKTRSLFKWGKHRSPRRQGSDAPAEVNDCETTAVELEEPAAIAGPPKDDWQANPVISDELSAGYETSHVQEQVALDSETPVAPSELLDVADSPSPPAWARVEDMDEPDFIHEDHLDSVDLAVASEATTILGDPDGMELERPELEQPEGEIHVEQLQEPEKWADPLATEAGIGGTEETGDAATPLSLASGTEIQEHVDPLFSLNRGEIHSEIEVPTRVPKLGFARRLFKRGKAKPDNDPEIVQVLTDSENPLASEAVEMVKEAVWQQEPTRSPSVIQDQEQISVDVQDEAELQQAAVSADYAALISAAIEDAPPESHEPGGLATIPEFHDIPNPITPSEDVHSEPAQDTEPLEGRFSELAQVAGDPAVIPSHPEHEEAIPSLNESESEVAEDSGSLLLESETPTASAANGAAGLITAFDLLTADDKALPEPKLEAEPMDEPAVDTDSLIATRWDPIPLAQQTTDAADVGEQPNLLDPTSVAEDEGLMEGEQEAQTDLADAFEVPVAGVEALPETVLFEGSDNDLQAENDAASLFQGDGLDTTEPAVEEYEPLSLGAKIDLRRASDLGHSPMHFQNPDPIGASVSQASPLEDSVGKNDPVVGLIDPSTAGESERSRAFATEANAPTLWKVMLTALALGSAGLVPLGFAIAVGRTYGAFTLGQVGTALALALFLGEVAGAFGAGASRFIGARHAWNRNSSARAFWFLCRVTLIFSVVLSLVLLGLSAQIESRLQISPEAVVLGAVLIPLYAMHIYLKNIFFRLRRLQSYLLTQIATDVVFVAALLAVVLIQLTPWLLLPFVLSILLFDVVSVRAISRTFYGAETSNFSRLEVLKHCMVNGTGMAANLGRWSIGPAVMALFLGHTSVGLFVAAMATAAGLPLLTRAGSLLATAKVSRRALGDGVDLVADEVKRSTRYLGLVLGIPAGLVMINANAILALLFRPYFSAAASAAAFAVAAVYIAGVGRPSIDGMTALGRPGTPVLAAIAGFGTSLLVWPALIPHYGITAGGWGLAAGAFVAAGLGVISGSLSLGFSLRLFVSPTIIMVVAGLLSVVGTSDTLSSSVAFVLVPLLLYKDLFRRNGPRERVDKADPERVRKSA